MVCILTNEFSREEMSNEEKNLTYKVMDIVVCKSHLPGAASLGDLCEVLHIPENYFSEGPQVKNLRTNKLIIGYRAGCYTLYKKNKPKYAEFSWGKS